MFLSFVNFSHKRRRRKMSSRWSLLKQLLRPHATAASAIAGSAAVSSSSSDDAVGDHSTATATAQMLQRLCWFQESIPLERSSQQPATFCVYVQQTSIKPGDSMPKSTWETRMNLWSAVLPWETARGLSGASPRAIVADPLLDFIDEKRVPSSTPTVNEIAESGEIGMLFLHTLEHTPVVNSAPPSFWSGAITTPIDIGFIQRTDPYAGVRGNIRKALGRLVGNDDPNFGKDSLRADGMELIVADCNKLEPFEGCDQVNGTPLAQLYPDLYGKKGSSQQQQTPARRTTEVTSRAHKISLVLETRRGMFRDHITHAVSHAPRIANDNSQANVVMMLKLSDELHDEIEEKRQLLRTMVTSLERNVRSELAKSSRQSPNEEEKMMEENEGIVSEDTRRDERRHHRSRDPDTRRDDDDIVRVSADTPTLNGRQSVSSTGNTSKSDDEGTTTSARRASRYPRSDPSMVHLTQLNYPLLVLAFKLSLCVPEIMALGPRIVYELQRGTVDTHSISWLLHFVGDTSLSLPDELINAIRAAAHALDVQDKANLDCDWTEIVNAERKKASAAVSE
ncbi:Hypothetical protein, putative [Bodo saltans]|uniref:Uncharacterized protein n=1 Tax=Bodo saltans TaxID=75058 RepID=A0A0S4JUS4_BODSA|nr:Hypothetical protein, putative [Bodo saltans]|eukprot:CUG93134.1 Hypothetical protein, putative [Bodo saltans]